MTTTLIPPRQPSAVVDDTSIRRDDGGFVIPAGMLAEAFALSEDEIRRNMREAKITVSSDMGVDEDAGRWRLTFYYRERACRFIVDGEGRVLSRANFPIGAGAAIALRKGRIPF